ncbi:hypothetical protein FGRMN_8438 [Fusarium graminum]|nr:hypothetical protein FGRMN_8438 [Fusarium graminum]
MVPTKKRKTPQGAVASPTDNDNTSGQEESSPRKRLVAMELPGPVRSGIETRAMSDPSGLPMPLADMRTKLLQFGRGRGIIGVHGLQSIPDEAAARAFHPDMAAIYEDKEFSCSTRRDALGVTPSPEDVLYILECAAECLRKGRSEAAWSNEVHFPLLCLALRPRVKSTFQRLVNVTNCSTASIVPDYRPRLAPDETIDFCVYLDPHYDPINKNIASTVDRVRARLPLLTINAIDDLSLLSNPIAIAIETRRPGEGLDTANLQVATFLTAHLALLQRLVNAGATVPVAGGEKAPSVDDLGFVPGLIVQGNTWNFIAARRQESRVVVWSGTSIGSTGDMSGIYQIIASLQLLRQWISTTYWPWLRRVIDRAGEVKKQEDVEAMVQHVSRMRELMDAQKRQSSA